MRLRRPAKVTVKITVDLTFDPNTMFMWQQAGRVSAGEWKDTQIGSDVGGGNPLLLVYRNGEQLGFASVKTGDFADAALKALGEAFDKEVSGA